MSEPLSSQLIERSTMSSLDRPIWSALSTLQAGFARGTARALAFRADVEPFAAALDDDPQSLEELSALSLPGDVLLLIQADASPTLPGLELVTQAVGVQMIARRRFATDQCLRAVRLTDDDAPQMLELATLTRPGPFRAATHRLGQFWGVRQQGRLAAMAGERLKLPGFTELSGVCTHPDFRRRGLAEQLSALVAGSIQERGETPFLHVYADNKPAIKLYERLGFSIRTEMAVQSFAHPQRG